MRQASVLPLVTAAENLVVSGIVAALVLQSARSVYAVAQIFTTDAQELSTVVPQKVAPPPLGPACTQWRAASALAGAPAWYARQASEFPVIAPAAPASHVAQVALQILSASAPAYCALASLQLAMTSAQ